MALCDFSHLVCPRCGFDVRTVPNGDERSVRRCESAAAPREPSIFSRAWSYGAALVKWIAAGRPTRTDAEVLALLTLCQSCPHFRSAGPGHGECALCGCGCSASARALANKLRMGGEHCPDEPPRW